METTAWKRGSPGEWRLGGEAAGGDAPRVQIHPPAECPVNLQMQSVSRAVARVCIIYIIMLLHGKERKTHK